ncbi:MAG: DsbA family protein [Leptospirillia bacterium]
MSRSTLKTVLSAGLLLLLPACGGDSDTQKEILAEIKSLRAEVAEIAEEVSNIKAAPAAPSRSAGRPPAPTSATVNAAPFPAMGNKDAAVTIVEFSDYQCPFCRRHTNNTIPQLKANYIDKGQVRYVYVDNPIASHRHAPKAAEAAHCAGEQGKFWQMHDHLFANQHRIRPENFPVFAAELKLDTNEFGECLDSGRHAPLVEAGRKAGTEAGARGTPTFVIGKTRSDGTVSGDLVVGAKAYSVFEAKLSQLLGS